MYGLPFQKSSLVLHLQANFYITSLSTAVHDVFEYFLDTILLDLVHWFKLGIAVDFCCFNYYTTLVLYIYVSHMVLLCAETMFDCQLLVITFFRTLTTQQIL
jgi:hypothetical protein